LDISNVKSLDVKKVETKGKKWSQDYRNNIIKWLYLICKKNLL
jgi:hypothetical protein